MQPEIREPAVAGRFYPGEAQRLERDVTSLLGPATSAEPAIAVMVPHAGYVYSGAIAGETFARVRVPSRAVVMCPNHTGQGSRRAMWGGGTWRLPGGDVHVDDELATLLAEEAGLVDDHRAHLREHAVEVELPFLRALRPDVSVVPIVLGGLSPSACRDVGEGLARVIDKIGREDVLIVASSDMSHYISADAARRLDAMALERVQALDPEGLYDVVTRNDISMCGFIPMTVALVAARALGATRAELVRYGNSGETSGDFDQVVGYAGIVIS